MILLTATTHTLEVQTSSVASTNWQSSWVDITSTTFVPDSNHGTVASATTTTVVAAPAASTQRQLKSLTVFNNGTVANVITIKKDVSGTEYILAKFTLLAGYFIEYTDVDGFKLRDNGGRVIVTDAQDAGLSGATHSLFKVGSAPEAAGSWYSWGKDAGFPGAWAPGAPGLVGRATDGTTAADAGCVPIRNSVGANYLTYCSMVASTACSCWLFDVLLVNTGIVVTTVGAQVLNTVALPARDATGTVNGEGCWLGLLVTTATTNAALINNMTMSYTNSLGVAGRTATVSAAYPFPATAALGTVVWFQLQASDVGVQTVQNITLVTSLLTGAVSVIIARPLFSQAALVANVGGDAPLPSNPGARLYNGTCALPIGLMSGTGATTLHATLQVMDR